MDNVMAFTTRDTNVNSFDTKASASNYTLGYPALLCTRAQSKTSCCPSISKLKLILHAAYPQPTLRLVSCLMGFMYPAVRG
eukprot:1128002-Pelagomonas_calceolata.AAC.8